MGASALRVIDANLNRAQEALRVIEDYVRFISQDRDSAEQAKHLRHALHTLRVRIGAEQLLAARDVAGDVGREVKSAAEAVRATPAAVAGAAFGRLREALRSLGEFAKLHDPGSAAEAERLRYRAYELETLILARGERRARFAEVRLYVLITASLCRRPWLETAEAALRGGAGCLQLREKELPAAELLRRARQLRELTARLNALLIINDRPDIALLAEADGVHLGQEDLPVEEARRIIGAERLIGKSTHTAAQFAAAGAESPDYLAIGPMFSSTTKPRTTLAGLETLRTVAGLTDLPVVAIGGIEAENARAVRAAGAAVVCVCSAVISQPDPAASAAAILNAL